MGYRVGVLGDIAFAAGELLPCNGLTPFSRDPTALSSALCPLSSAPRPRPKSTKGLLKAGESI